jgi:hypothetical protein
VEKPMSSSLSPTVISIHHDGIEVVQIIDGKTTFLQLTSPGVLPKLLEFYWDGALVYRLMNGVVEINEMNLEAA